MERYVKDTTCPKCGCTDIAAEWMPYHEDYGIFGEGERQPQYDVPEHIARTCRWCKYAWREEPLDVPVREIDVKSDAG